MKLLLSRFSCLLTAQLLFVGGQVSANEVEVKKFDLSTTFPTQSQVDAGQESQLEISLEIPKAHNVYCSLRVNQVAQDSAAADGVGFEFADGDGNGFVSRKELKAYLNQRLQDEQLPHGKVFSKLDADSDKRLTEAEFEKRQDVIMDIMGEDYFSSMQMPTDPGPDFKPLDNFGASIDDRDVFAASFYRYQKMLRSGKKNGEKVDLSKVPMSIAGKALSITSPLGSPNSSSGQNGQSSKTSLSDLYKASVILVGGGNDFFAAGGVIVGQDGIVVTNYHVAEMMSEGAMMAMAHDGKTYRVVEFLAGNEQRDVALVRIAGSGFTPAKIATRIPQPGDDLEMIHHSESRFFTYDRGYLLRHAIVGKDPWMEVSMDYAPGGSGCGIFNDQRELVGLVSTIKFGDGMSLAEPFDEFLDGQAVAGSDNASDDEYGEEGIIMVKQAVSLSAIHSLWSPADSDSQKTKKTARAKDDGMAKKAGLLTEDKKAIQAELTKVVDKLVGFLDANEIAKAESMMTERGRIDFLVDIMMAAEDFDWQAGQDGAPKVEINAAKQLKEIVTGTPVEGLNTFCPQSADTEEKQAAFYLGLYRAFGPDQQRVSMLKRMGTVLSKMDIRREFMPGPLLGIKVKEKHVLVSLPFVQVDSETVAELKAKGFSTNVCIYRFVREGGQWKLDGLDGKEMIRLREVAESTLIPDFQLQGTLFSKESFDIKKYRGKYVLVDFWGTWCAPCIAELPDLKLIHEAFQEHGFEIVGVAVDGRDAVDGFLNRTPLPWEQVMDGDTKIAGRNNVTGYPTKFLIDPEGNHIERNPTKRELIRILTDNLGLEESDFDELRANLRSR